MQDFSRTQQSSFVKALESDGKMWEGAGGLTTGLSLEASVQRRGPSGLDLDLTFSNVEGKPKGHLSSVWIRATTPTWPQIQDLRLSQHSDQNQENEM